MLFAPYAAPQRLAVRCSGIANQAARVTPFVLPQAPYDSRKLKESLLWRDGGECLRLKTAGMRQTYITECSWKIDEEFTKDVFLYLEPGTAHAATRKTTPRSNIDEIWASA
jgi:hypothetical protein